MLQQIYCNKGYCSKETYLFVINMALSGYIVGNVQFVLDNYGLNLENFIKENKIVLDDTSITKISNKIIELTNIITWNNFDFFKHHMMIKFHYREKIKSEKNRVDKIKGVKKIYVANTSVYKFMMNFIPHHEIINQ